MPLNNGAIESTAVDQQSRGLDLSVKAQNSDAHTVGAAISRTVLPSCGVGFSVSPQCDSKTSNHGFSTGGVSTVTITTTTNTSTVASGIRSKQISASSTLSSAHSSRNSSGHSVTPPVQVVERNATAAVSVKASSNPSTAESSGSFDVSSASCARPKGAIIELHKDKDPLGFLKNVSNRFRNAILRKNTVSTMLKLKKVVEDCGEDTHLVRLLGSKKGFTFHNKLDQSLFSVHYENKHQPAFNNKCKQTYLKQANLSSRSPRVRGRERVSMKSMQHTRQGVLDARSMESQRKYRSSQPSLSLRQQQASRHKPVSKLQGSEQPSHRQGKPHATEVRSDYGGQPASSTTTPHRSWHVPENQVMKIKREAGDTALDSESNNAGLVSVSSIVGGSEPSQIIADLNSNPSQLSSSQHGEQRVFEAHACDGASTLASESERVTDDVPQSQASTASETGVATERNQSGTNVTILDSTDVSLFSVDPWGLCSDKDLGDIVQMISDKDTHSPPHSSSKKRKLFVPRKMIHP